MGIFRLRSSCSFLYARSTKWTKTPISCQQDLLIRKSRQTGRAAVALDLQPFTLLLPPQVFLAENLHNSSCTNRGFARFVGRIYGMLLNERCLSMSVRPCAPCTLALVGHAHPSEWLSFARSGGAGTSHKEARISFQKCHQNKSSHRSICETSI